LSSHRKQYYLNGYLFEKVKHRAPEAASKVELDFTSTGRFWLSAKPPVKKTAGLI